MAKRWGNEEIDFDEDIDFDSPEKNTFPLVPVLIGGIVLLIIIILGMLL